MSSKLSAIPVEQRRRMAAVLGLFAALCVAIGAVAATDTRTAVITAFAVIALVLGLVLAAFGWGVVLTIRADTAENRIAAAVEDAVAASGRRPEAVFGCGHDHDPDELHVTDAECEHDGTGTACLHDCSTCLLTSAGARRPRPAPTSPE